MWHKYPSIDTFDSAPNDESTSEWLITEKVHGSNLSIMCDEEGNVQTYTRQLMLTPDRYFHGALQLTRNIPLKEPGVILYGEIFGGKVQRDIDYGEEVRIVWFDVMKDGHFLRYEDARRYCENLGLVFVPVLYKGSWSAIKIWIDQRRDAMTSMFGAEKAIAEGVVIRQAHGSIKYKYRTLEHFYARRTPKQKKKPQIQGDLPVDKYLTDEEFTSAMTKLPQDATIKELAELVMAEAKFRVGRWDEMFTTRVYQRSANYLKSHRN